MDKSTLDHTPAPDIIEVFSPTLWSRFLALALTVYFFWRLWRFHLVPLLYPTEPLVYPYLIPVLGHAIPFFKNSYQMFEDAREYFGSSQPVYNLVIAGKSMYIVTDVKATQELYKNAKALSWESFVKDLFIWLGFPAESVNTLWKPPTQDQTTADPSRDRAPVHMMEKYQRQQCLPGDKSRKMTSDLIRHVRKSLEWTLMSSGDFVTGRGENSIEVDLYAWTTQTFVTAVTEAYWGKRILDINPNLVRDYASWEKLTWKYIFQLPKFMSKDMYSARDRLISTFHQYFELDSVERTQTNWWVPTAEAEFRAFGLDSLDVGRAHMLSHWAVNGNMHKVAFWMLTHILHDAELRQNVEAELRSAYVTQELRLDVFEQGCSNVDAVWYEVLRMRMATSLARKVVEDTYIGPLVLKKGHDIVVPYKVLHNDVHVWGSSPDSFDKRRFLDRPELASHINFRPFGGGAHLCPGRFIGKQLVYTFLAATLLDMKPSLNRHKGCGHRLPRPREDKPALGSLPPVSEDRVFLTLFRHDAVEDGS